MDLNSIRNLYCCNKFLFYPIFHIKVKESRTEQNINIVDIKTSSIILEISSLVIDLLKNIGINYIDAFLVYDQVGIFLKHFLILLHNVDGITLYKFYKEMIEIQKAKDSVQNWIFLEEAIILMNKVIEYKDETIKKIEKEYALLENKNIKNLNMDFLIKKELYSKNDNLNDTNNFHTNSFNDEEKSTLLSNDSESFSDCVVYDEKEFLDKQISEFNINAIKTVPKIKLLKKNN